MNCMNELCQMSVYWINYNKWICNELWMNFEFNKIEYTNGMNWNFSCQ